MAMVALPSCGISVTKAAFGGGLTTLCARVSCLRNSAGTSTLGLSGIARFCTNRAYVAVYDMRVALAVYWLCPDL